jgi:tetratricopeptide (TPR) repeat protein
MDSRPRPQNETERVASSQAINEKIIEAILSEEFTQRLNALPKRDERRALALFRAGRQFAAHYQSSKSLASLDHAIAFTAQALEETPNPHPNLREYATIYAHLLQLKAERTGKPEDGKKYILGLKKQIESVGEGGLKEAAVRELGMAYFSRFGQSKDFNDLEQAIEILERCFETPQKTFPQPTIYLGAALYYRFSRSQSIEDLSNAVHLLHKGLQCLPLNEGDVSFLHTFGLGTLASACKRLNNEQPAGELLQRIISIIEEILEPFPSGIPALTSLRKQHICALMRRHFKGPETAQEIIDIVRWGFDKDQAESQTISPVADVKWHDAFSRFFTHQPLRDDKHNIRLIYLLPGGKKDPIKCEVIEEKLDGAPQYEVDVSLKE